MDIHRCRFVPYPPSAITALAFSHNSPTKKSKFSPRELRLAVGRANGDLELWNPSKGNWFQETIFRGGADRTIEGLAWTQDTTSEDDDADPSNQGHLRLFSIGNSTSLTEWNLVTGQPARQAQGNFGDLWCIAAQPSQVTAPDQEGPKSQGKALPSSQLLAAGCSDGSIVLFSTEDDDLRFVKTIGKPPTKKPRVLSITWKSYYAIVAGYDDGNIRVYDVGRRTILRTMSLGKAMPRKPDVYVWAVRSLPNGTIISGDSTGELKIWDASNYTLVQRLQAHQADVLDVVASSDGKRIITGGADRRTVIYHLDTSGKGQSGGRWAELTHRRYHQHDVKAMAVFESNDLSVVVSGGLDTVPVVMPLREWDNEYHRSLSNLPQKPPLCSAPNARLMLAWWGQELSIWRIPKTRDVLSPADQPGGDKEYNLASRILLKDEESITTADISKDGMFVAVATTLGTKVFQLRRSKRAPAFTLRARAVTLPVAIAGHGAKLIQFSPNGRWLCIVRLDNTLLLAKFDHSLSVQNAPAILDHISRLTPMSKHDTLQSDQSQLRSYHHTICNTSFSLDSRVIVAADLSGQINVWVLEGDEDTTKGSIANGGKAADTLDSSDSGDTSEDESDNETLSLIQGQRWIRNPTGATLPRLDCAILVLSFRPHRNSSSLLLTNGNIGLHATRHNPHPHTHNLPIGECKLVAVTADHRLIEFDVLESRVSDWSRRNPSHFLPESFKKIRDRAKGMIWSSQSTDHERLWLYGPTWMFMIDLSQDLPEPTDVLRLGKYEVRPPVQNSQNKRKRDVQERSNPKKRDTGAGGKMRMADKYLGLGQDVWKYSSNDAANADLAEVQRAATLLLSDDDDNIGNEGTSLALMRRQQSRPTNMSPGIPEDKPAPNGAIQRVSLDPSQEDSSDDIPPRGNWTWRTHSYYPILGIVPLEESEDWAEDVANTSNPDKISEIAICERPLRDIDLPPRFDGG